MSAPSWAATAQGLGTTRPTRSAHAGEEKLVTHERLLELARDVGVGLQENASLAPLTRLSIGGPTPALLTPQRVDQVQPLLRGLHSLGLSPRWLGAGSNLLIDDRGVPEPVVCTARLRREPQLEGGDRVRVSAGTALPGFTRWLVSHGLCGLEFAEGIPGSIGGAVTMNAGAFEGSVGKHTVRVILIHPDGRKQEHDVQPEDFSYRRSVFSSMGALVLEAVFLLKEGDPEELGRTLETYRSHIRQTQPLSEESAGCIFRNPLEGPSAGSLIDRCGLKGRRRGNAEISPVHANFIVNRGGATSADARALIEEVKEQVQRQTGVLLQEEVRVWSRS